MARAKRSSAPSNSASRRPDARRAALLADPQFKAYVQKMQPLLVRQESRLLIPASFFTPTWQD
ncbi:MULTISPECIES: NIPSNAP family protein [unclassified Variovorax]|uniref:NIPSNAP family protein n=1 Tax=unclassified Variovorax TaxID=663243 RepID=UPI003ECC7A37